MEFNVNDAKTYTTTDGKRDVESSSEESYLK